MKQKRTTGWPFFADPTKHRALVGEEASANSQLQAVSPSMPRRPDALRQESPDGNALSYDFSAAPRIGKQLLVRNPGDGVSVLGAGGIARRTCSWK